MTVLIAVGCVVLSMVLSARMAERKGRSVLAWLIASVLFPLPSLLVLWLLPPVRRAPLSSPSPRPPVGGDGTLGRDDALTAPDGSGSAGEEQGEDADEDEDGPEGEPVPRSCPHCGRELPDPTALLCPACGRYAGH